MTGFGSRRLLFAAGARSTARESSVVILAIIAAPSRGGSTTGSWIQGPTLAGEGGSRCYTRKNQEVLMLVLGIKAKPLQQIAVVEMEGAIGPRIKPGEYGR